MIKTSIDPRTRIFVNLSLTMPAILFDKIEYLLPLLIICIFSVVLFSNINFGIIKKTRWLITFFIFVALTQSFFVTQGEVLLSVGGFSIITTGGLVTGLCFLCRMLVIFLGASILAYCGSRVMIQAMVGLKIRYEIAFMSTTATSFLPLFAEEFQNSMIALQLRGIEFKKLPIGKKFQIYFYLLIPVIEGIIIKAKELSCAMEMRGYRAYDRRTSYIVLNLKALDYLIIIFSMLASVGSLVFYYLH